MKVLLLWNKDREDGWLLGDLSFVLNDLIGDFEAACEEIKQKVPDVYFEDFFQDSIFERLEEEGYSGNEQENNTFKFESVTYKDYVFNFLFKDQEGEEVRFVKECADFIEPYLPS